jgi:hypoxanthine phosphoribosyltransferase
LSKTDSCPIIVAIPRGGLVIAGILAKQLGDEKIVPVISLSRLDGPAGFDNPFNHLIFKRQDFQTTPVKILIVDDISRSGRTLAEARTFVDKSIDHGDFVINTAAISFYRSYSRATEPSFIVVRPQESIRDASGEWKRCRAAAQLKATTPRISASNA